MTRSDARRIAVIALRSRGRYLHESGPELRPRTRAGETDSRGCGNTVTGEPSLELLIGVRPLPARSTSPPAVAAKGTAPATSPLS